MRPLRHPDRIRCSPYGACVCLLQRGHECKATLRAPRPLRLRLGRCVSKRRYRPKHCGLCSARGLCCTPRLSSSIKVPPSPLCLASSSLWPAPASSAATDGFLWLQVEFECEGEAPSDPEAVAVLGADMWTEDPEDTPTTPYPASSVLAAAPIHDNLVGTVRLVFLYAPFKYIHPYQAKIMRILLHSL